MPIAILQENDLLTLTASGKLTAQDRAAAETAFESAGGAVPVTRSLIYLRDFLGFAAGSDQIDMDSFARRDAELQKIAVVGDPQWRDAAMVFLGAGYRKAQVRYFAPAEVAQAHAWLDERPGAGS
jgi:hypothetical protein